MNLERNYLSLDGLIPFCLALQSFLGFLWLLDSLGVEVNVVVHRMWELRRFEVGNDPCCCFGRSVRARFAELTWLPFGVLRSSSVTHRSLPFNMDT